MYGIRGEGTSNYLVTLSDGRIVRRHVDHIRSRTSQATDPNSDNDVEIPVEMSKSLRSGTLLR